MTSEKVYPSTMDGINDYYNIVVPYLTANASRLGISPVNLTALNALFNNTPVTPGDISNMGWQQLWVLYSNKKTACTTAVRDQTKLKDKAMQHLLSSIYNDIPASVWTKTDRDTTGRKGPALGHKAQTTSVEKDAATNPSLELGGKNQLVLRIPQAGGQKGATKKKSAKPKTVKVYLFHYIVQLQTAALPTTISQCTITKVITRSPTRLNFDPSQEGMRCCGFVETIEKPNKSGPISPLVSAIIP